MTIRTISSRQLTFISPDNLSIVRSKSVFDKGQAAIRRLRHILIPLIGHRLNLVVSTEKLWDEVTLFSAHAVRLIFGNLAGKPDAKPLPPIPFSPAGSGINRLEKLENRRPIAQKPFKSHLKAAIQAGWSNKLEVAGPRNSFIFSSGHDMKLIKDEAEKSIAGCDYGNVKED